MQRSCNTIKPLVSYTSKSTDRNEIDKTVDERVDTRGNVPKYNCWTDVTYGLSRYLQHKKAYYTTERRCHTRRKTAVFTIEKRMRQSLDKHS